MRSLGYHNVTVYQAGDVLGRSENSQFDAIIVAAAAPRLPRVLLEQLSEGGRVVIPVGSRSLQDLLLVTKSEDSYSVKNHGSVSFRPAGGGGGLGPSARPRMQARGAPSSGDIAFIVY